MCLFLLAACAAGGIYALKVRKSTVQGVPTVKRVKPEARRTAVGRWAMVDTSAVLDNQAVVNLARTNISARTLVKVIERSPCRFDMSPSALIRMKENGVADDVLYAMLNNLDQCFTDAAPQPTTTALTQDVQDKVAATIAGQLTTPVQ